jgi:hypothetical protein
MTSALTTANHDLCDLPANGLCPASPQATIKAIGVDSGRLYYYSEHPGSARDYLPEGQSAIYGAILDVSVAKYGKAGERKGTKWEADRDHLSLLIQSPTIGIQYRLLLPAHASQVSYRTLLGHLTTLDLRATAVKLEAKPGNTAGVTIFHVFLDPVGLPQNQVKGTWIGGDLADLQIAVDACRRSLALPPQFPEWVTPQSPTPSPQTSSSDC